MQPKLERLREVEQFVSEALEKYPELIRSIVLVGSVARGDFKATSDTDVLVVLDDFRQEISKELAGQIHEGLAEIARKFSRKIYIAKPPISAIQLIRNASRCNPYVYNILKEGVAIYDRDFFVPFQEHFKNTPQFVSYSHLLNSLTEESKALRKIELELKHFRRVRPIEYINCMISSAQLLLMGVGTEPPTPMKIYDAVGEHLVKPGFLKRRYANCLKRMVSRIKRIEHHPWRYGRKGVLSSLKRISIAKRFVKEMQILFLTHAKPDAIVLMTDGGEKLDRKFPKDKSLSISKSIMRAELEKILYEPKLTRREFLKAVGLGGVAVGAAVSTGCVDFGKYFVRETPAPKKRFTPELRIEGDEEFKRNMEHMLSVLKEYSPEWYEKTMYAGEVIVSIHHLFLMPN